MIRSLLEDDRIVLFVHTLILATVVAGNKHENDSLERDLNDGFRLIDS